MTKKHMPFIERQGHVILKPYTLVYSLFGGINIKNLRFVTSAYVWLVKEPNLGLDLT